MSGTDKELKQILCNILKVIKEECCFTYKDIIDLSGSKVNSTQVGLILKSEGKGVSTDLIYEVIKELGYTVEISIFNNKIGEYI